MRILDSRMICSLTNGFEVQRQSERLYSLYIAIFEGRVMGSVELKSRMLKLLREEFRHAVAGLIGLDGILKRLRHEEFIRLGQDVMKGFEIANRRIDALGARWISLMEGDGWRVFF